MRGVKLLFITFAIASFAKFAMPKPTVEATVVSLTNRAKTFSTLGTIIASNSTIIKSKSSGTVREIIANSGSEVKKNDIILQMDDSDEVDKLNGLKATLDQKEWFYNKTNQLYEQKASSKLELEIAKQNYLVAKSEFKIQKEKVSDKQVVSPFDGVLGIINPHVGDYLNIGMDIVSLQNKQKVWVDFALPQDFYNKVKIEDLVKVNSSLGNEFLSANIVAINKSLNEQHQIRIRAQLSQVPEWLAMGSYCVVNLTIGKPRPVILIPLTAVQAQSSVNKVFVVKNNIVEERIVTVGSMLENGQVEILSGINDKESVITLGGFKVYNGMEVIVK